MECPEFGTAAQFKYLIKEEVERLRSGKSETSTYTAEQDLQKLKEEEAGATTC
jgi:hypothetical protein